MANNPIATRFVLAVLAALAITVHPARADRPDAPPSEELSNSEIVQVRSELNRLKAEREEIDQRIEELELRLKELKTTDGSERDLVQAAREFAIGKVHRHDETATIGSLDVNLIDFSHRMRKIEVEKKFDMHDIGIIEREIPIYGVSVRLQSKERGRILTPFYKVGTFGGIPSVTIRDNWGNVIKQERMQSTEYEIRIPERTGIHFPGKRLLPGEEITFFIPTSEPEITDVDFFVITLKFQETSSDGESGTLNFVVPKDKVSGLGRKLQ